jgi:hypothetical protein
MQIKSRLLILTILALGGFRGAAAADFIAGSTPSHRPDSAPVIKQHELTPEALGRRLHGVADPLPNNVVDAALAGAWFMPLAYPGMTGPYDIRGWHRAGSASASRESTQ